MRLTFQEGPFALIVVPYREQAIELARRLSHLASDLKEKGTETFNGGYPQLKVCECVGGDTMKEQEDKIREGCHIVVGTTGRLLQMLEKGSLLVDQCQLISLLSYRLVEKDFEDQTNKLMSELSKAAKNCVRCLYSTNTNQRVQQFC